MQSIEEIEAICYDNLLREAEEWCEVGHGWVWLAKVRECLYWRPFGGDSQ